MKLRDLFSDDATLEARADATDVTRRWTERHAVERNDFHGGRCDLDRRARLEGRSWFRGRHLAGPLRRLA